MRKKKKPPSTRSSPAAVFKQRLQHVCDAIFCGRYTRFAAAVGYANSLTWFGKLVYYDAEVTAKTLSKIIKSGVVNAEYLMCGTGPATDAPRENAPGRLALPETLQTPFSFFDTGLVQFTAHPARTPPASPDCDARIALPLARAIHAARAENTPVILYVTERAILDGASPVIAQLLHKQYVTSLVCTTAAAYRDVEFARYGGFAETGFDNKLIDINEAAALAANNGLGYGEAVGRWCFPRGAQRELSAIATAYELGAPVVIQATLGDSPAHWFPSKRGAELGAAIGAASYADMLIFAQQLLQCAGTNRGVFISTDQCGADFLIGATRALESDASVPNINVVSYPDMMIGGEHRLTFPALLAACDAVYDGSADNGTRPCRVRRN